MTTTQNKSPATLNTEQTSTKKRGRPKKATNQQENETPAKRNRQELKQTGIEEYTVQQKDEEKQDIKEQEEGANDEKVQKPTADQNKNEVEGGSSDTLDESKKELKDTDHAEPVANQMKEHLSVGEEGELEEDSHVKDQPDEQPADTLPEKKDNKTEAVPDEIPVKDETQTGNKETKEKNAFDEVKSDVGDVKKAVDGEQEEKAQKVNENTDSIVEDPKREAAIPSSILEKGIVYFFYRPRVGIEDPKGISDVARTFIVLRPIPLGAQIGQGPLEDDEKARLLALPKKMVPKGKQDRFLMFTDKVGMSIKDIRDHFASNQYATKTSGLSNSPAAAPFAEGVYVFTKTNTSSHLAYILTKPSTIGDIQKELGLHERGSFLLSAKNPKTSNNSAVSISKPAEYPEDIQTQFRGRNWMPLLPEMLDYEGTQFLIMGEGFGELAGAAKEVEQDKKDDEKKLPEEELEDLGDEDHDRVANLEEDDPVFADLALSSKEYCKIEKTW